LIGTARYFCFDFKAGSEKERSFLIGPFLTHVRETYNARTDRRGTLFAIISMGSMDSLRLA